MLGGCRYYFFFCRSIWPFRPFRANPFFSNLPIPLTTLASYNRFIYQHLPSLMSSPSWKSPRIKHQDQEWPPTTFTTPWHHRPLCLLFGIESVFWFHHGPEPRFVKGTWTACFHLLVAAWPWTMGFDNGILKQRTRDQKRSGRSFLFGLGSLNNKQWEDAVYRRCEYGCPRIFNLAYLVWLMCPFSILETALRTSG